MRELWYRQPAKVWEEALPLGNGRIGAMVFGNIENERIQVNEESIWYGGKKDRINPDAKENLPKIRELIQEGHISAAQDLMAATMTGCPASQNPYQTLGDLKLYFQHQGVKKEGAESPDMTPPSLEPAELKYRRSLSLSEGICRTEYALAGVKYVRECFISKPADCMILRIAASEPGRISFTLKQERGHFFKGVGKVYGAAGELTAGELTAGELTAADGASADAGAREANGVMLYGRPGEDGNAFVMMTKCNVKGGVRKVLGEGLIVEGADEAILVFGVQTQYRHTGATYEELEKFLNDQLEQVLQQDYEALRAAHIADHKSLFDRVELKLYGEDDTAGTIGCDEDGSGAITEACHGNCDRAVTNSLPTDERLARVQAGETDLGLEELLFDYGRYLMIAGSRPGGLPLTLQGLWNKDFTPPWESKYTININLEMNYWPAEVCNLSECHLPLVELLKKMRTDGRKVAREMYGCRGFVAHHNTDMHGDCAPQDLWIPATYWPMGAAWLATHLWTHYEYTKDLDFLKEAFPVMAEAALYFVDALQSWGDYYVTNPSCSPENTYILPNGDRGCVCLGPTMDNQILRDLFEDCLKAYAILGGRDEASAQATTGAGADAKQASAPIKLAPTLEQEILSQIPDCGAIAGLMCEITDRLSKLPPTKIGSDGRIMEWLEEYEELEPGHRHVSQLYGLYPSDQITADGTPELAAAALRTLEARLASGGGHTGWSRAWIMNHYAKLWDGEEAHEHLQKLLAQSTYPNLFDRHPPFQIDGNFGATAAIAQMLVQSSEGRVVLLPALPKAWKSGGVKGLRLVGNAEIDLAWKDGEITSCEIKCDGEEFRASVRYAANSQMIALKKGEKSAFLPLKSAM